MDRVQFRGPGLLDVDELCCLGMVPDPTRALVDVRSFQLSIMHLNKKDK